MMQTGLIARCAGASFGRALLLAASFVATPSALAVCPAGDVLPRTTTYNDDVKTILDAQCIRCHGATLQQNGVRVDSYEALVAATDTTAASLVVDVMTGSSPVVMPPSGLLDETTQLILCDWEADGFEVGETTENQPPEGTIDTPVDRITVISAGESVAFSASAADPDNNLPLSHLWRFQQRFSGVADSTAEDPGPVQFDSIGFFDVDYTVTDSTDTADRDPDLRTIVVNSAIQEQTVRYDLDNGTLTHRPGDPEDSYRSTTIEFPAATLTPTSNTVRLTINFADDESGAEQSISLSALGTGSPRPETFASRIGGDCNDGMTGCSHDFGPGMIAGNAGGNVTNGFTNALLRVELIKPDGAFASDFANPYFKDSLNCTFISTVGSDEQCVVGPHFPDLVDGDNTASFSGLTIDLMFDFFNFGIVAGATEVTVDRFAFNLLAGDLAVEEFVISIDPLNPAADQTFDITINDVWRDGCVPGNPQVQIEGTLIRITATTPQGVVCTQALQSYSFTVAIDPLPAGDYTIEYRVDDTTGQPPRASRQLTVAAENAGFSDGFEANNSAQKSKHKHGGHQ